MHQKSNPAALLPIVVFLILYLGNGIFFEYIHPLEGQMGFYIISVVVAFTVALAVALLQNRRISFDEKIHLCAKGIGDDNITIQTSADDQNPAHVVKKEGLYNLQAREYFLNSSKNEDAKRATTSSSAVIHLIDKALVKGSN